MIHVHGKKINVKHIFYGDQEIHSVQWQGKELLPKWQTIGLSGKTNYVIDGNSSIPPEGWTGYCEVVLKDEEHIDYKNAFDSFKSRFIRLSPSFKSKSSQSTSFMFLFCSRLTELDLSNLSTSGTKEMDSMFYHCASLASLDLSSFDTSNVVNMSNMFGFCESLKELDLSSFNTSNLEYTYSMFENCESLTELDLSSFDTSSMVDMSVMFEGCSSLVELDLSSFDTSNVQNMDNMFEGCTSLKTVYCRTREDAERFKNSTPAVPSEPGTEPVYTEFVVK